MHLGTLLYGAGLRLEECLAGSLFVDGMLNSRFDVRTFDFDRDVQARSRERPRQSGKRQTDQVEAATVKPTGD